MSELQTKLRSELDDCDQVINAISKHWSTDGVVVMPERLMEFRHWLIEQLQQTQLHEFNRE